MPSGWSGLACAQRRAYLVGMELPNRHRAVVDDAKVRDYLLSTSHPIGRFKASFFLALGFSPDAWQDLQTALLDHAHSGVATPGQESPFGTKYEIRAALAGPAGRTGILVSVWMVSNDVDFPTFITAFPG